jgi:hypothetical protein
MKLSWIIGAFILVAGLGNANAEKRLALIIVNQEYPEAIGWLANTPHDADLMQKALEGADFKVTITKNRNSSEIWDDISALVQDLSADTNQNPQEKSVGFFYYSGHGASDGTDNYIIPSNTTIKSSDDLKEKAVSERLIVEKFSKIENDNNFVVLDACREIAFPQTTKGSARKGLIPIPRTVQNVYVVHSAAPNAVTADDNLYATVLSEEIAKTPSVPATYLFKDVRKHFGSRSSTNPGDVNDMRTVSFENDFYFHPGNPQTQPQPYPKEVPSTQWQADRAWDKNKLFFVRTSPYYRSPESSDPLGEIPAGTLIAGKVELGRANRGTWYKYKNLFGQEVYSRADEAETIGQD